MSESRQLPLFDEDEVPGLAGSDNGLEDMTWSYSRRASFETCLRRYYFEYFGANMRTALDERQKEKLHFLNGLKSRHLRAGDIIHTVIRTYFRKAQAGEIWDVDRLIRWAASIFQKDREFSRTYSSRVENARDKYPPQLLVEYYYQVPDVEDLCDQTEEQISASLFAFGTDDCFREFIQYGSLENAVVERSITVEGLPCRVTGKIDLAYEQHDFVTVVDWKTGCEDGVGDNSLQLAVYGLWALQYFQCTPPRLIVSKAFLGSGDVVAINPSQQLLEEAKTRILQDIERMAAMNEYALKAIREAFTLCLHANICSTCSFQGICYA